MADDGLLRSLGEKPIWEGVWPHLDAMDTVCLRTVSMEWNMPEKYGPHGVLLFFLIQKKPAIVRPSTHSSRMVFKSKGGSASERVLFLGEKGGEAVALSFFLQICFR